MRTDCFSYAPIPSCQVGGKSIGGIGKRNSETVADDVA